MKRYNIRFYECEHHGDLGNYAQELGECGATIVKQTLDEDNEEGVVKIEINESQSEFIEKFKQTDSYYFSHLGY